MDAKGEPPGLPEGSGPVDPAVRAYLEWAHLKQLYRRGWLRAGVPPSRCETVAEHSFAVALLAVFLAGSSETPVDPLKAVRMALLHDLGETHAGDRTPHDGVDPAEKHAAERRSFEKVVAGLPGSADWLAVWDEYERGESPEARFVRQLDRLEMGLQAVVYERQGLADLGEFFEGVRPSLTDPALRSAMESLESLRPGRDDDSP